MVTLQFHGHACWEIRHDGGRILIDPFLTGNPKADVGPEAFDELDAIVLTHGHGDHIGDTVAIAEATGALVVSNYEIATWAQTKGLEAHPMHIGGGRQFEFGHVKFTVAHHGSTGPDGEPLGNPMGVVLTLGETRVYHAGDTGLFGDMKLIGEQYGPLDVALLPIGDNFTMGVDDAIVAARFLQAGVAIPMHYDTFGLIEADPQAFVRGVEAAGLKAAVVEPGGAYEVG